MSLRTSHASLARCAVVLLAGILIPLGPAVANPLLDCAVLVHVQPLVPNFCDTSTISDCQGIAQYTERTGLLEFDLFVYTPGWGFDLPVANLTGSCEWPADWQLAGYEICSGGEGIMDPLASGMILDLFWPECPTMDGEVFLAARILLDVGSHGSFSFPVMGDDATIRIGCPPNDELLWVPLVCSAEAGVVCDYCEVPCDLTTACNPRPDPTVLELECIPGGSDWGEINGVIEGHGEFNPCEDLYVAGGASWLDYDLWHSPWDGIFQVYVEADAQGLAVGTHETWLRVVADCAGCTRVVLHVRDPQSVPEDPGDLPPATNTSWGRLKRIYR